MALFCPATGLKVISKPEWTNQKVSETFEANFWIIGDSIIYSLPKGFADLTGVRSSLTLNNEISNFVSGGNKPYIQIEDYAFLEGSSFEARKFVVNNLNDNRRRLSIIFCNASLPFSIAVKMGRRFNTTNKHLHVSKNYQDAVKHATELAKSNKQVLDSNCAEILRCFKKYDCSLSPVELLSESPWQIQTPNFTNQSVIVNHDILHSTTRGFLESKNIDLIEQMRIQCRSALPENSEIQYIVVDGRELKGGSRTARVKYMQALKNWHQRFPFRMYIVYNANKFMKTALFIAKALMPFKVRTATNINQAFQLIDKDKNRRDHSLEATVKKARQPDAVHQKDVEKLVALVGSLNWEEEGKGVEEDIEAGHPLYLLYQSIKLLKEEISDLFVERRQFEEVLRQSEEKFRCLVESSSDWIWEVDSRGCYTYSSPVIEQILGYKPEEIIGKTPFDLMVPEEKTRISEIFKDLIQKKKPIVALENVNLHKDGQRVILETNGVPVFDEIGRVNHYRGVDRDITARKHAEEALRKSHATLLTVLDSIDATVYVADLETYEILFNNKYMIKSFGKDMVGETCWNVFRGESGQCPDCTNDKLIDENGKPTDVFVWHGQNPITGKWYINYDRVIPWIDGQFVKLQIATDISELKKMEEELIQSRKMESIGTLAGGIAHDFNNILHIMIGNVEMALEEIHESIPAYNNLENIKTAGLRGASIVKQLLNYTRKTDQKLKPVNAVQIIQDSLKLLRSTIPTTIDFQTQLPDCDIIIMADVIQINQVLMNICTNAYQAMEITGGILEINVERVVLGEVAVSRYSGLKIGEHIKISIADNGPGLNPEIIDKIFDPYFTTKEVGKGSGLGLSVVHGIVKNHNGVVSVDNYPGKGATFNILFPVVDEKPTAKEKTLNKIPTGTETILFVDDEAYITDMVERSLEKLGYHVETSLDPVKALELFKSKPNYFDLVITDMSMPQMNGAKLSEKLQEIRPEIPIIICTGYSSLMDEKKAKQLGIADYILKPMSISGMSKVIRKALDG